MTRTLTHGSFKEHSTPPHIFIGPNIRLSILISFHQPQNVHVYIRTPQREVELLPALKIDARGFWVNEIIEQALEK
jgi:hypothetical protein